MMQEPSPLDPGACQHPTTDRGSDLSSSAAREIDPTTTSPSAQHLSTTINTDKICDKCSALDWKELFNNVSASGTYVGSLNQLQEQLSCDVCRLFDSLKIVCDVHKEDPGFALYTGMNDSSFNIQDKVLLLKCCKCGSNTYKDGETPFCIAVDEVGDGSDKIETALVARQIESSSIDFSLVQSWIDGCVAAHPDCNVRAQAGDVPKCLRLIDCSARTVVEALNGQRYAALSYVWGQADRDLQPLVDGRLPESLALTIEDAITATKRLGLNYLWIDRFCIDQSNEEEMSMQVNQMDLVYACAFITIVAAAGQDSSYGLPGVSSTPRRVKLSVRTKQHNLVTIPHNSEIVSSSVWKTRGWTMQEHFFSSKLIMFTEEQVYYECRRSQAVETIAGKLYPPFSIRDTPDKPASISTPISAYSGRKLSYDADAINAFAGVFHHYGVQRFPVYHHIGIPIVSCFGADWSVAVRGTPEPRTAALGESFVAGLCWGNEGTGQRRGMFPSWSWAGWTCKLSPHHPELNDGLLLGPDELPKVMWEDPQGRILPFDRIPTQSRSHDLIGKVMHLETWTIPLLLPREGSIPSDCSSWKNVIMLENDDFYIYLPANFCENPKPPVLSQQGQQNPSKDEVLGLLLGKTDAMDERLLIVRCLEQYFERVGYFHVQPDKLIVLDKSTGEELPIRSMDPWDRNDALVKKVYHQQKVRRRVRLG